ncbi:transglycosylase SLT domain-containing protein [uncultured Nocardioides sp.]|uniref:transglycosylase SLT domain-containing protein n=1 Tax=uncultured Nocardioides sp. TaxID=198441 RepID=UPI0025F6A9DD|nr:transglycosylase SLT domain-containing protein [uncultured Nocardioides sp.]
MPLALRAAVCAALTTTVLSTTAVSLTAPATADHADLPDGRDIRTYTVRAGDTATGLATRFHAWTAELVALNHLGPDARLQVGQRLRIPVVRSAAARDRTDRRGASPSRERVRSVVVRVARRHGVDPQLALAVSWQESGWQMQRTSSAGAIGAMQVLRGTADWMELYADRPLRPRRLRDNVVAGVLLLRLLDRLTDSRRHQVAAYYQGLGAVRRHGLYDESKAYVANVLAIKRRLEQGRPPA